LAHLDVEPYAGVIPLKGEQPRRESAGEILKRGDDSLKRFAGVSGVQLKRKPA
jgi:hypothetical protein